MKITDLYGPDGVWLDGPRTTAAEQAVTLAMIRLDPPRNAADARTDEAMAREWRNAADYEGQRYIEALTMQNSLRRRTNARWYGTVGNHYLNRIAEYGDRPPIQIEREHGAPAGWLISERKNANGS